MRSTPRPRRWRCSKRRARRSPICRSSPMPGRPGIRAARPSSALGRRPSSPASASFTRGLAKSLDAPAGAVAAEIYLDAIPAPRSSGRARAGLCAAGAAGRSPATSPSSFRRSSPPTLCSARSAAADKAAITGVAAVRPVRERRRPVAGLRGDAAAGREELHRRADRRDLQPDHRRCGEARRAPEELVRAH